MRLFPVLSSSYPKFQQAFNCSKLIIRQKYKKNPPEMPEGFIKSDVNYPLARLFLMAAVNLGTTSKASPTMP